MRLIEKIVDKFLNDADYVITIAFISLPVLCMCVMFGMTLYTNRLDHELKLAKIAAGQVVDCGSNCKCK
jgi:hypothetical protein